MNTDTFDPKQYRKMDTTQASPNGGGWEWGLKNPTQTKDIFNNILQLAFRSSTFERTFEGKHETFYYLTLCKKESDLLFIQTLSSNLQKGQKKVMEKSNRTRQKKAETKEKGGEKGRKPKRQLKTREGKNRAAN